MEIDGITSTYLSQMNNIQTSTNTERVQNLADSDLSTATDEELMDACKEFESYLLEQVMKQMEKTTTLFSDEEDSSNGALVDYFMDSTIQDIAGDVTQNEGLGIAQALYESMKRNYVTV
jgi:flagellar protein FlgJ